jgi:hypothetical protein
MGRPKETPFTLLEGDLKQTLKLHKEIRDLIQAQLGRLREKLATDIPTKERLEILEALTKMSDTLTKSAQQTAKFVMQTGEGNVKESVSESQALDEMLLGKQAKRV